MVKCDSFFVMLTRNSMSAYFLLINIISRLVLRNLDDKSNSKLTFEDLCWMPDNNVRIRDKSINDHKKFSASKATNYDAFAYYLGNSMQLVPSNSIARYPYCLIFWENVST